MFGTRLAAVPGTLAANADRDRAIDVLKAGFAEGRLTKGEYDDRTARIYASRTYGELGSLIADLPNGPLGGPGAPYPLPHPTAPTVSSKAVASLVCGIFVFFTMGLTSIPAVILGHAARRQVRRTGQRGDGMALTGLSLGYVGIALLAALVVGLIAVSVAAHGIPAHAKPNPGGPIILKPGGAAVGG